MAYEQPGFQFTLPASSALATDVALDATAARRFRFLYVDSSSEVDWAVAGDHDEDGTLAVVGVMQNSPQSEGDPATIVHDGITKLEAGTGGVTAGQRVVAIDSGTSGGRAVDVTQSGDDQVALGIALQTATVGQLFACLLIPGGNRDATSA